MPLCHGDLKERGGAVDHEYDPRNSEGSSEGKWGEISDEPNCGGNIRLVLEPRKLLNWAAQALDMEALQTK